MENRENRDPSREEGPGNLDEESMQFDLQKMVEEGGHDFNEKEAKRLEEERKKKLEELTRQKEKKGK